MSEFVRFREESVRKIKTPQGSWRYFGEKYKDPEDAVRQTLDRFAKYPRDYFSPQQMQFLHTGEDIPLKNQVFFLQQTNIVGENPSSLVSTSEFLEMVPSLLGEDQIEYISHEILPELQNEQDIFFLQTWNKERFLRFQLLLAHKRELAEKIPYLRDLRKRTNLIHSRTILWQDQSEDLSLEQDVILHERAKRVVSAVSQITFLTDYEVEETARNERNLGNLYLDTLANAVPILYDTVQAAKRDAYAYKTTGELSSQMDESATRQWQRRMAIENLRYGALDNTAVRSTGERLLFKGKKA